MTASIRLNATMLRRAAPALLVSYVLVLGVGGLLLARAVWKSVIDYRTPYAFHADLRGGDPLTERLVLVVLDGIRVDAASRMEFLSELANRGSSGTARVGRPSLSNPSRAVIATGAWPEVNGVTNNSNYLAPKVDSIFSLAERSGVPRAAVGSRFWSKAFGAYLGDRVLSHRKGLHIGAKASELIAWHQTVCAADTEFLRKQNLGLAVIGLTAADSAGHDFGGRSQAYIEVVKAVDGCLRRLAQALDDGRTSFVITSDHGHIQRRGGGGHGGGEQEVLNVPLVFFGRAIRKNSGWRAEQVDIAPTICALLGLPLPATNQGRILWQALDVPPGLAAQLRERAGRQRELAQDKLPDRRQGLRAERRARRLPAIGLSIFLVGVLAWVGIRRPRNAIRLAGAVLLYYGAYYLLFWAFGLGYSLSVVGREQYLVSFFARDVGAAAVALMISSMFLVSKAGRPWAALLVDSAVLVSTTLALQVTAIYFQHGLLMDRFMPDLSAVFKACLDLLQIFAVGLTAVLIFFFALGWERRAERRSAATAIGSKL